MDTQKIEVLLQRNAELEKELAAKNRELKIEAALDRVRTRAMAMQRSDELKDLIALVSAELTELDFALNRCSIFIFNPETKGMTWWMAHPETPLEPIGLFVKYHEQAPFLALLRGWQDRQLRWQYLLEGEVKKTWDKFLFVETELSQLSPLVIANMRAVEKVYLSASYNNFGGLSIATLEPLSNEQFDVLLRFAKVFDLTYTRFNDLKLAEAQAREAQIEAALERVRAKALSMQSSYDLLHVATILREQMGTLGQPELESCIVHIYNDASRTFEAWYAYCPPNHASTKIITDSNIVPYDSSLWSREVIAKYKSADTDYTIVASGEKLAEWYKVLEKIAPLTIDYDEKGQIIVPEILFYHFSKFSGGALLMISNKEPSLEACELQKRAALVFGLAYTRFLDLRRAEIQAQESKRQASLDRIRAEIASMRTTGDLERITPLVWNELTTLDIPFSRCGVFIMDDAQQLIHTFLSTPEGSAIAAFHLPYTVQGNVSQILEHWQQHKIYLAHWSEAAFQEFSETLVAEGVLPSPEYYLKTIPAGGIYLHCVPFLQGMLYVGNVTQLKEPEIRLVQSVADAFSTAYARYEDFNKLEAAKQQVEATLADLKSTQAQLIQKEKMASLGELTAGIAHEIQNPLNFVNNFAEANLELLTELQQEIMLASKDDALALVKDVLQNEQKIHQHGRRADSIVKRMMEHSRNSGDKKDPTGINALVDEYLKLAFHGFRVKDNTFKVILETHYDPYMDKIDVQPQEIGRVLLNLFNNAFYAVQTKKQQLNGTYEPVVSVSTKIVGNSVVIAVKDNGTGMSPRVVEKVFQPFFTTKPTGEGTGLGLYLSYDIVTKGHGGRLSVQSTEGEGSEFVVELPTE